MNEKVGLKLLRQCCIAFMACLCAGAAWIIRDFDAGCFSWVGAAGMGLVAVFGFVFIPFVRD